MSPRRPQSIVSSDIPQHELPRQQTATDHGTGLVGDRTIPAPPKPSEKGITMFTEIRKRTRKRRQRASMTRIITADRQPQRDELIVMTQYQGLL